MNCGKAVPATHEGVSKDHIAAMEKWLETQLPTDVKDYLTLTNRFHHDRRICENNWFTDASHMVRDRWPYQVGLLDWRELPFEYLSYFNWPEIDKGIQIGLSLAY